LKHSKVSDEQIKMLEGRVAELESQQREKIAEVLSVRRFREGLEKLRAEAKRRFMEKQEKLEQKELDEVVSISFARGMIQQGGN
jgi:flagellar biosynthesis chaperone FliJ